MQSVEIEMRTVQFCAYERFTLMLALANDSVGMPSARALQYLGRIRFVFTRHMTCLSSLCV